MARQTASPSEMGRIGGFEKADIFPEPFVHHFLNAQARIDQRLDSPISGGDIGDTQKVVVNFTQIQAVSEAGLCGVKQGIAFSITSLPSSLAR